MGNCCKRSFNTAIKWAAGEIGGSVSPDEIKKKSEPPKFNNYETKKVFTGGLLTTSLLLILISHMKALIDRGEQGQQFYWLIISMVIFAIVIHIINGVVMLIIGIMESDSSRKKKFKDLLTNIAVALSFMTVLINSFVGVFGFG